MYLAKMNIPISLLYFLLFLFDPIICKFNDIPLSDCEIVVLSLNNCENEDSDMSMAIILKTTDDNGGKAVDVTFDLDEPVTSDYMVLIQVDTLTLGIWEENIFTFEESLCVYIKSYAPKIWEKFRKQSVPPIERDCEEIEPGHYEVRNFEISPGEIDFPVGIYGMFRMTHKVLKPNGDLFFCHVIQADVGAKGAKF